jgi:glycosyltransferase involved in cell wall biosynthesis
MTKRPANPSAASSNRFSVVIATLRRPELLERCVTALVGLDRGPDEIIVVDNSTGDPATESVAREHGTRYLRHARHGLSGARNAGALAARATIVAFLDDDAVPEAGWRDALEAPFVRDGQVVAAAGRIYPLDQDGHERRYSEVLDLGPTSRMVDRDTADWFEICNFGGVGTGGNMAIRASAFSWWPGFRDSLGLGSPIPASEEHYAFFEFVRAGYRVAYVADAVVRHPYPLTESAYRELVSHNAMCNAAYATLLLIEEPTYRRRLLRHLFEAARGKSRPWRPSTARLRDAGVPFPRIVLSCARGPLLYFRSRSGRNPGGVLRRSPIDEMSFPEPSVERDRRRAGDASPS